MPNKPLITADQQVLEVVAAFRSTEQVFKQYEADGGPCICCEALFETLDEVARRYNLDLGQLLNDLNRAARAEEG